MTFAEPTFLVALLLVPLVLLGQAAIRRRRAPHAVRFTGVPTLKLAGAAVPAWRRHVPAALGLAALTALILALAKPQRTVAVPLERASIMLVTDHSRSMSAEDVAPTRLTAAKRAAHSFLEEVPAGVRVGIVAFSDAPDAVQMPSADRDQVRKITEDQIAEGATATGEALQVAVNMLVRDRSDGRRIPAAIVLLSDGKTTTGRDPVTVAARARRLRIPIFTVSLGTRVATVTDPISGRALPANPDPETLEQIAETSDGRPFTAEDAEELSAVYRALGSQLGTKKKREEVTVAFALGASLLLLGAVASSVRWTGRLP